MRRAFLIGLVACACAALGACAGSGAPADPAGARALAPTGALRVGLYSGTPTSIVGDASSGNAKGVGFDLGKALAERAGVPFSPVVLPNNAAVQAAAKAGNVDMVFTNATPARRQDLDFSDLVLEVELGYLVPGSSALRSVEDVDRAGIRVGVSEGSTSEATLSRAFKQAAVVRAPSLKAAVEMLASGKLDAFATNKATLFEMSDELPGARVLAGRWGVERFAIGLPKGREAALPLVNAFVKDAKRSGAVMEAVGRAGLRGADVAK